MDGDRNMKKQIQVGLAKYQSISPAVKASLWFAICNILQRGISIITVPIFTRILSTSEMGVFNVYNSWYSIVSTIFTMNLSWSAYTVGLAKFEDDEARFTSSMQGITLAFTGVGLIIFCLAKDAWSEILGLSSGLIILMFIETAFAPALQFWSARERYYYRYRKLVIVSLLVAFITPILGIAFIFASPYRAEGRIVSTVLLNGGIGIVLTLYFFKKNKRFYDAKYWKFAFAFALPLIPHYLSQTILNQSDRIMIDKFYGKEYAAIYGVAYSVASIFTIVNNSINHSMTPWLYKSLKKGETRNISKVINVCSVVVLLLNVLYIIFAPEVIAIFAPPTYHEAIWVIPPLALSVFMMFIYNIFTSVEFYYEKSKFTMYSSIVAAGMNVFLNYIFIPKFGFLAAGYTSLFCYVLYAIGHYFIMRKVLRDQLSGMKIIDGKMMIIISFTGGISTLVVSLIYGKPIIRYGFLVVIIILAVINREKLIDLIKEIRKE